MGSHRHSLSQLMVHLGFLRFPSQSQVDTAHSLVADYLNLARVGFRLGRRDIGLREARPDAK
jgi:hypothetical protein